MAWGICTGRTTARRRFGNRLFLPSLLPLLHVPQAPWGGNGTPTKVRFTAYALALVDSYFSRIFGLFDYVKRHLAVTCSAGKANAR